MRRVAEARAFYGGEAPVLATQGEIGGDRHYEGAGLGQFGAWKCPACGTENVGAFEQGCPSCGAGSGAAYHVGHPPPAPPRDEGARLAPLKESPAFQAVKGDLDQGIAVYDAALAWASAHMDASRADAFVAGYQLATAQLTAHTMRAAPVTADVAQLAPEGKSRRTIVAALKLFRDQVLSQTPDEIESGEWCSLAEVDEVIQQLEAE